MGGGGGGRGFKQTHSGSATGHVLLYVRISEFGITVLSTFTHLVIT